jgi:hypothetical protein
MFPARSLFYYPAKLAFGKLYCPSVHLKLNTGKEPFKCGIGSAGWLNNKATKEQSCSMPSLLCFFVVQKISVLQQEIVFLAAGLP